MNVNFDFFKKQSEQPRQGSGSAEANGSVPSQAMPMSVLGLLPSVDCGVHCSVMLL